VPGQATASLGSALESPQVALKQQALHYQTPHLLGDLAFALLLFSFGYVALQMTFAK